MRVATSLRASVLLLVGALGAQGGSIYLTGHDVLLHSNQTGYTNVILDYLRGATTGSEIAAPSYNIGLVRGFAGFASTTVLSSGYGTLTTRDLTSFVDASDFATFLGTVDVLVIPSHTTCGGCDLSDADSAILNSFSPEIAAFFNAGGDIWGNSGALLPTFYNFLPPGAVASGLPISGSSGFTATPAGVAIGIVPTMINGFQTHNRFTDFDPDFTVFETRGSEIISIGIRDARISDGGIDKGPTIVPEPSTFILLATGVAALLCYRRRSWSHSRASN